jgi:hypothetical protein
MSVLVDVYTEPSIDELVIHWQPGYLPSAMYKKADLLGRGYVGLRKNAILDEGRAMLECVET